MLHEHENQVHAARLEIIVIWLIGGALKPYPDPASSIIKSPEAEQLRWVRVRQEQPEEIFLHIISPLDAWEKPFHWNRIKASTFLLTNLDGSRFLHRPRNNS